VSYVNIGSDYEYVVVRCEFCYALTHEEDEFRHRDICPVAVEALKNSRKGYWR
jgi:hypothetical protein